LKEIQIRLENRISTVRVGGSINELPELAPPEKTIIVTDENLNRLYHEKFSGYRVIVIGTGEGIKTVNTVEEITSKMIQYGADRSSFLVAVGGGIVCDIAGFAASIFMRGIRFGFISTSVLSQVDASVGGKNGVNLGGLKNMLGVFNQPDFVICDHEMLSTLPDVEYTNGLSEVIKSACLGDTQFFEFLEENKNQILEKDMDVIHEFIKRSVMFKASIVEEDEKESGIRKILNLGHTIGHGLEKIKSIPHGFAIAAGMGAAAEFSVKLNLLNKDCAIRIMSLIDSLGLDSNLKNFVSEENIEELITAISSDKKKQGASVDFILLEDIGRPVIKKIEITKLRELLGDLLNGV